MSALDVFTYADHQVRTVVIDGEPWFVLADVTKVLGLARGAAQVSDRLPDGVRQTYPILDSLGRTQQATIVSESGLYRVILRSDAPGAEPFMEWITSDVLPTIRKTGRYGSDVDMLAALPSSQLLRLASEAAERAEKAEAEVKALAAPAGAWNDLAAADGDVTISDAAKVLGRAGLATGPRKLHDWLEARGWIFRRGGAWVAMQTAVNAGYLVERVSDYRHPSGERRLTTQIRVTPKGLERLRVRLTESVIA